ncbi:uncharacterized protein UV8b_01653 [Ustilaginoidea virens]|uniref:Protein kinase domain-containing protein n=1 Tax=Ustilaginoidea virens TaxID=1159556 RepID=A0A8E5HLC2_USTVR|nr:uncharacterized protein UV8b_01653 [Ustilaginoidea virens]QUC17412.1 hypothetical protein UV8b_01653 [Ustilaginoidea virens]
MSTIQQLKNFIRHGKQARTVNINDDTPRKDDIPAPPAPPAVNQERKLNISDPALHHHIPHKEPLEAYSEAPGDAQNRAAQAGIAAAHRVEPAQDVDGNSRGTSKKRVDDASLAMLVAEENASRTKFPRYPGLERWELIEKMGDGAFSNVYRARDLLGVAGEVAIKVVRKYEMNSLQGDKHLHPDFKKAPKAAERSNILKEVQIMRQLDHPNITKLIDFSESKQYYYIVLELAPGGELFHQIVRLTYFSEELSRHVIIRVARALEYLHEEKGVVHRDIKPENILFYPIPFIPSKVPKPRQPGDENKVDEGEFIPGLGAEVLTEKVARGQYTFLSPWWDDISQSAKELITHLLTVDPEKRYTIREFLAHPWIQGTGPTPQERRRSEATLRAFDAGNLDAKRYDFRSPGVVNLREVFDVSYAVHRQEEEGKRRAQIGARAGGMGKPLGGLNEEDEEDEDRMQVDPKGANRALNAPAAASTHALEQSMRHANIRDQEAHTRGRERERAPEKGYGQHSAAVTAAARQQVRDRNRHKGPFELNLENATLLGKRGKKIPAMGA